jgi:WD40 repeat protein
LKKVRVWDLATGTVVALRDFFSEGGSIVSIAFDAAGSRLVVGLSDSLYKIEWTTIWDFHSRYDVAKLRGLGDVFAIAAGPNSFPWRAMARGPETVIEQATGGSEVAWFPAGIRHIVTHTSGNLWAGSGGKHMYLVILEGHIYDL